jgi:hypothetical protein
MTKPSTTTIPGAQMNEREGEISHAMIFNELLALRERSERRDATLERIEADLAKTKEIVEAWVTAKNMGKFAKWLAGIAGMVALGWAAVKALAHGIWP